MVQLQSQPHRSLPARPRAGAAPAVPPCTSARRCPRVCRYHEAKGFQVILVAAAAKLLTLGFTVAFSALLLLCVRWRELHAECVLADTCDLAEARLQPGV